MGLSCFVCERKLDSWPALSLHLKVFHSLGPADRYICGQGGCQREFHVLKRLKSHIFNQHKEFFTDVCEVGKDLDCNVCVVPDCFFVSERSFADVSNQNANAKSFLDSTLSGNSCDLDCSSLAASFIARLKSNSSIPANATDDIVNAVQEFFGGECIKALKDKTVQTLVDAKVDINTTSVQSLMTDFDKAADMFHDLQTPYLQMKYFKESGCYIEPESFSIGTRLEAKRANGTVKLLPSLAMGQHVPLRKVFHRLFQLPGVLGTALAFMSQSKSGIYSDFKDGKLWKDMVSRDTGKEIFFPYMLYFDDFETANPLGSRAGIHKLGSIYACLKCFPPKYNSKLKNLFLSLLFYTADRTEFGNESVFGVLLDEIKYLRNTGITVDVLGCSYVIRFQMVQLLGDNLGLNSILGYTESFSATYYCRLCKLGKDCSKAHEEIDSLLRNVTNYETDLQVNDISLTGIKQVAVWNNIDGYHVTRNYAFDIMHDLLEGVCRYDMGHVILYLVREKFLNWDILNARVQGYDFEDGCNRPPVISPFKTPNEFVKMKASEMKCLVMNFALMVGDLVVDHNDPIWCFYLCLRQILDIVFASEVCEGQLVLLKTLVAEHHKDYVSLFGDNLKPKHHFMLHYPRAIMYVGPLQWIWSMRFESKHGEAKKLAVVNCNFKNICKSIAQKHQLKLSYRFMMKDAFQNDDLVVGTGSTVEIDACNTQHRAVALHGIVGTQYHAKWIILNGIKYSSNKAVIMGVVDDMPSFGILQEIYVDSSRNVNFLVQDTVTICFQSHFHAYEVSVVQESIKCIQPDTLLDPRTLHCRKLPMDPVGFFLTMPCAI